MNETTNKIEITTNLNSSPDLQPIKKEGGSNEEIFQLFNESVKSETPKMTQETLEDQAVVKINSQGKIEIDTTEKEFKGDLLPNELISLIFSFVDKEVDSFPFCMNKDLRNWAINDFKIDWTNNFRKLSDAIIEILQKKAPDFDEEIGKIKEWNKTISIKGDDRITIDASVRTRKKEFIYLLVGVYDDIIDQIKSICSSGSFGKPLRNIGELITIYEKFDPEGIKSPKITEIESAVKELLLIGEVDEALEIANLIRHATIPSAKSCSSSWRDSLEKIIEHILTKKKIEKSLEIVNEIPEKDIHPSTLKKIIDKLLDLGKIDETVKLAEKITDKEVQSLTLKEIALSKLQRWEIESAIEIIEKIYFIDCRIEPLKEVAKILVAKGDTTQALEVSKLVSEPFISQVHLSIVEALLAMENINEAKEIANKIEEKVFYSLANRKINQFEEKL